MGDCLLCFLDHILVPVDCILGVPVGEVLLHDGGLPVDDGKHQRRQPGVGGDRQQLPSLREIISL